MKLHVLPIIVSSPSRVQGRAPAKKWLLSKCIRTPFVATSFRESRPLAEKKIGCLSIEATALVLLKFLHWQHTHTRTRLMALFPGLPRWACTRNVKPIWILVKQETVSGSGISWAICKSALRSRQITMPAPHHSVFYRLDALPAAQPTASKHWMQKHWKQLHWKVDKNRFREVLRYYPGKWDFAVWLSFLYLASILQC